jgi:hypothetical protein
MSRVNKTISLANWVVVVCRDAREMGWEVRAIEIKNGDLSRQSTKYIYS